MCYFFEKNVERNKQQNWNPETLNPLNDVSAVSSIDNSINLKDVFGKVGKLGEVCDRGQDNASLIRYITDVSNVSRQGEIFNIVPNIAYAIATYVDKKTLEFTIELAEIHWQTTATCALFYQ